MNVFGLQDPMMRSARLADKICDDLEVAHRLRILERCERLREKHGLSAAGAAEVPGKAIAVAAVATRRMGGRGCGRSVVGRDGGRGTYAMPRPCGVCGRSFPVWDKAKIGVLLRREG